MTDFKTKPLDKRIKELTWHNKFDWKDAVLKIVADLKAEEDEEIKEIEDNTASFMLTDKQKERLQALKEARERLGK